MTRLARHIRCFCRSDDGAALVEFGMVLPVLLLVTAVIVEGGRITWAYQSVSAGVRDAARMIARIAPPDLCPGGSVGPYDALATEIVSQSIDGSSVMPRMVTVLDVEPTLLCVAGAYRVDPSAVVQVRARVRVDYIFGNVFSLFGTGLGALETEVADQSRVFGT